MIWSFWYAWLSGIFSLMTLEALYSHNLTMIVLRVACTGCFAWRALDLRDAERKATADYYEAIIEDRRRACAEATLCIEQLRGWVKP